MSKDKKREGSAVFNLEQFFPTVDTGKQILDQEILKCRRLGIAVLKVIHGYGSTGRGGNLRTGIRSHLKKLQSQNIVTAFVPGENFSIFDEEARAILAVAPELRRDPDLERSNQGITLIHL